MMWFLFIALVIEFLLILFCHYGVPIDENLEQSFYPDLYLTGSNGKIGKIENNSYIIETIIQNELFNVKVYSKSNKSYNIGDSVSIVEYSDGLYFIP